VLIPSRVLEPRRRVRLVILPSRRSIFPVHLLGLLGPVWPYSNPVSNVQRPWTVEMCFYDCSTGRLKLQVIAALTYGLKLCLLRLRVSSSSLVRLSSSRYHNFDNPSQGAYDCGFPIPGIGPPYGMSLSQQSMDFIITYMTCPIHYPRYVLLVELLLDTLIALLNDTALN
jgi:hypothetical protein